MLHLVRGCMCAAVVFILVTATGLAANADVPRVAPQKLPVIKVEPGYKAADLWKLRPGQLIETPSGKRVSAGRLRAILGAFDSARKKNAAHPEGRFAIMKPPAGPCTPIRSGESPSETLARTPSQVVCLAPGGKGVTVAQLRAMAPVARNTRYQVALRLAPRATHPVEVEVRSRAELMKQLRTAPDATVVVSPQGRRTTIGELRRYVHVKQGVAAPK